VRAGRRQHDCIDDLALITTEGGVSPAFFPLVQGFTENRRSEILVSIEVTFPL
jgi:hypothetical protein